jgi:ubiquinone/menaquinone biosynthesis C-methylase UbiE
MLARLLHTLLRRYADDEAKAVAPFLVGKRLLDLGAGEAYVAVAVRRLTEMWVCAVDVGPYRRLPAPYVIYDGKRLPFNDASFDTSLISLVLHHCADPEGVLDEALRVTARRLLILESVYRNRLERICLAYLDDWLSQYRHDGDMHPARAFKRLDEWQRLFAERSLQIVDRRLLGSRWERLVHQPVLFVLDKPATHDPVRNGQPEGNLQPGRPL